MASTTTAVPTARKTLMIRCRPLWLAPSPPAVPLRLRARGIAEDSRCQPVGHHGVANRVEAARPLGKEILRLVLEDRREVKRLDASLAEAGAAVGELAESPRHDRLHARQMSLRLAIDEVDILAGMSEAGGIAVRPQHRDESGTGILRRFRHRLVVVEVDSHGGLRQPLDLGGIAD